MEQYTMKIRPRFRRSVRRRRSFSPPEPAIIFGQFVGRRLSELSDEELKRFLQTDARRQTAPVMELPLPFKPWCPDMSQYWFAKYELERRRPECQRDSTSLDIATGESESRVALRLTLYGYRTASRKYHPDYGGDTAIMQLLNAARDFARKRLES
jgi:hypothetical protein